MERDSMRYKIRRKGQVIVHKLLPDEMLSKIYFRIVLHKKLDLVNPKTFNEKLQWLKLHYYPFNPKVIQCADKYEVRKFISDKGCKELLVPLLGKWEDARNIDWNKLPEQFVLKCNHGCAYNIVCEDKKKFDQKGAIKKLNSWIKEDFGAFNIELHYSKIKPHVIICEEYLGKEITDYKFFCFNGKPQFIYISRDLIHDRQAQIGFFYLNGEKMPLKRDDYADISNAKFPVFFNEMVETAEKLCKEFPFVRVDFFVANNRFYFAELTFTPSACMMPFNPEDYDLKWGKMLNLGEEENEKQ